MVQLLDMLKYLRKQSVAHRDLKLENILIDEYMNLKVTDFGFAAEDEIKKLDTFLGTKSYMAPEILMKTVYDGHKADIFSLGVILFIMAQGTFPFNEATSQDYFYKYMIQGKHDKYFKKTGSSGLSDDLKELLIQMLSFDPK